VAKALKGDEFHPRFQANFSDLNLKRLIGLGQASSPSIAVFVSKTQKFIYQTCCVNKLCYICSPFWKRWWVKTDQKFFEIRLKRNKNCGNRITQFQPT
jgi:hypothetical protein